jgi:DNA-binding MarR family transcriptional regulator
MPDSDVSSPAFREALEAVVRAARVFAAITAESIAQAGEGVTLPQLRVLVLARTTGMLNNSAVAHALDIHISNASRICERLVQAGLLDRRHSPDDRRQVQLTLTPAGSSLVDAVTEHRRTAFTQILGLMSPGERASLAKALRAFVDVGEVQVQRRIVYSP